MRSFFLIFAIAILCNRADAIGILRPGIGAAQSKQEEQNIGNWTKAIKLRQYGYTNDTLVKDRRLQRKYAPDVLEKNDRCMERGRLKKCDMDRFENCRRDEMMCYHRLPTEGKFYDRKKIHPMFHITYEDAFCVPRWQATYDEWWNCNRCHPGKFCRAEGICMTERNWKCYCSDRMLDRAKDIRRKNKCKRLGIGIWS